MPDPTSGQDATVLALLITVTTTVCGFLAKLGDLVIRRLARRWGLDKHHKRRREEEE